MLYPIFSGKTVTHLSIAIGTPSLCGAEKRYPWILWDADWEGINKQHVYEIMHDKDGRPFDVCRRCYRLARAHLTQRPPNEVTHCPQ